MERIIPNVETSKNATHYEPRLPQINLKTIKGYSNYITLTN